MGSSAMPEVNNLLKILADPGLYKQNLDELNNALVQLAALDTSNRSQLEAIANQKAALDQQSAALEVAKAEFNRSCDLKSAELATREQNLADSTAAVGSMREELARKLDALKAIAAS